MPSPTDLPIDPDVDLHLPRQREELRRVPWVMLAAVSAGGILGACARHALDLAWPHLPGRIPWATVVINVSGCLLIGVLMVLITDRGPAHPLLRPFLGVGVLGGYTTFSTYAVDAQRLFAAGAPAAALLYLAGTALAALAAVYAGVSLTRPAVRRAARR